MKSPAELDKDGAKARELRRFACDLRGQFLEGTAWIEVLLTDILSHYFCSNKKRRRFFFSEIANGMSFRSKADLLGKIITYEFPELHQEHPRLKERLDKFREFRNILAHNHIDTSPSQLATTKLHQVKFVKYKLGQLNHVQVTSPEAKRQANEANQLRKELLAIQRRLFNSYADVESLTEEPR